MLYEAEIVDVLKQNLLSAAADCDSIAQKPLSGEAFTRMRASLRLCEGACRQMAYWRGDDRWLTPGRYMESIHQKARGWLHRPTVESKKLFTTLAASLRDTHKVLLALLNNKTGRVGTISTPPLYLPRAGGFIQVPAAYKQPLIIPA